MPALKCAKSRQIVMYFLFSLTWHRPKRRVNDSLAKYINRYSTHQTDVTFFRSHHLSPAVVENNKSLTRRTIWSSVTVFIFPSRASNVNPIKAEALAEDLDNPPAPSRDDLQNIGWVEGVSSDFFHAFYHWKLVTKLREPTQIFRHMWSEYSSTAVSYMSHWRFFSFSPRIIKQFFCFFLKTIEQTIRKKLLWCFI